MDKKKRRCLYGAEKKPNSILSIDTTISLVEEDPTVKKNKNGRITNLKVEEKIIEDNSTNEKSEQNWKSDEKSTKKDKIVEKSKEERIEDIKIEISNPKPPAKTKQRYKKYSFYICYVIRVIFFNH